MDAHQKKLAKKANKKEKKKRKKRQRDRSSSGSSSSSSSSGSGGESRRRKHKKEAHRDKEVGSLVLVQLFGFRRKRRKKIKTKDRRVNPSTVTRICSPRKLIHSKGWRSLNDPNNWAQNSLTEGKNIYKASSRCTSISRYNYSHLIKAFIPYVLMDFPDRVLPKVVVIWIFWN